MKRVLFVALLATGCASTNVDTTCDKAEAKIDLPAGAGVGLAVTARRDTECDVNVSNLPNFEGALRPGSTVFRPADNRQVVVTCGTEREKKCRFSYVQTRPRESATLAEETVAVKCHKGDTTLNVQGGNFTIEVQVQDTSKCPVTVTGATANTETVAIAKTRSFNKNLNATESATITLSCGTDTEKDCKYSYKLKSN